MVIMVKFFANAFILALNKFKHIQTPDTDGDHYLLLGTKRYQPDE